MTKERATVRMLGLRAARVRAGLSSLALAHRAGLGARGTVYAAETGVVTPTTAEKLAGALGVPLRQRD